MGADIVNIVDGKFSGRSFIHLPAGDWADLRAEIVRLRGEVDSLRGWFDASQAPSNMSDDHDDAAGDDADDIAPAEAKTPPAPAMPNGVEWRPIHELDPSDDLFWFFRGDTVDGPREQRHDDSDYWDFFAPVKWPPIPALRAADNRDAAGVVPAWIATWMADREILPDDDGDGISEGALVEALNNHERELLNAHHSACELGADGVGLIAAERQRQISAEGWTPEHDDEHGVGELATAAACYAAPDLCRSEDEAPTKPRVTILAHWPWALSWWKPGDRIRELVKAGALIAAEIDRLQRAALQHRGDSRGGEG